MEQHRAVEILNCFFASYRSAKLLIQRDAYGVTRGQPGTARTHTCEERRAALPPQHLPRAVHGADELE